MRGAVVPILAATLAAGPAAAGDPALGRVKSVMCRACHDEDGRGRIPAAPNLGGQSLDYMRKAIADFASRERRSDPMDAVVRAVDPADIEDILAWYASLSVEVKLPPP